MLILSNTSTIPTLPLKHLNPCGSSWSTSYYANKLLRHSILCVRMCGELWIFYIFPNFGFIQLLHCSVTSNKIKPPTDYGFLLVVAMLTSSHHIILANQKPSNSVLNILVHLSYLCQSFQGQFSGS